MIPEDLSEAVGELSGGSGIPVAIANEDRGTQPGERVVGGAVDEPDLEGMESRTAIPSLDSPPAASSTTLARTTSRCGDE